MPRRRRSTSGGWTRASSSDSTSPSFSRRPPVNCGSSRCQELRGGEAAGAGGRRWRQALAAGAGGRRWWQARQYDDTKATQGSSHARARVHVGRLRVRWLPLQEHAIASKPHRCPQRRGTSALLAQATARSLERSCGMESESHTALPTWLLTPPCLNMNLFGESRVRSRRREPARLRSHRGRASGLAPPHLQLLQL